MTAFMAQLGHNDFNDLKLDRPELPCQIILLKKELIEA